MSEKIEACGGCIYFALLNSSTGKCRRYPPQSNGKNHTDALQPFVQFGDWCGEFEQIQLEDDE